MCVYHGLLAFFAFVEIVSSATASANYPPTVTVATKLGKILGTVESTTTNLKKYFAFRGIPFAQPPTKELRFKDPVSYPGWSGVLDAKSDGPACPQLHIATGNVIGDEDCLRLNIYTPHVENLKPVVIWLHGGAFVTGTGSSELYGPDWLMDDGGIVVVTIQYRLGAFGFLNVGSGGNWGLKDQIEGLKWIQTNIPAFGGDPHKVSLVGEGAGAASATLLTLLPEHTKGLFRNVVALAGTPLNTQYFQKDPLESARELGSRLKCSYDSFEQLVQCLRAASVDKVVKEVNAMFSFFSFPRWFAPSLDSFLVKHSPEQALAEGKLIKVPILTGLARHEGAFYYSLTLNSFNDGKYDGNFIDQRLPRLLPVVTEFESKLFPLTRSLSKRYFTNIDYDNEDEFRPRYVDLLTDLLYTRFTSKYLNLLRNQSVPAFAFVLDYYGSNSIMDVVGDTDVKLIAHGDVLQYVWTQVLGENKKIPSDDAEFAVGTFLTAIIQFVKTGSPGPSVNWPQYDTDGGTFVSVGKKLSLLPQFRANILKFWEETVPRVVAGGAEQRQQERGEL